MQLPATLRADVELRRAVAYIWQSSISTNTQAVYNTGMKNFLRFLSMYNLVNGHMLPHVSEEVFIYYVAHCHNMLHLKYSTIKLYLAGIRRAYIALGLKNPLCGPMGQPHVRLQLMLRGIKKQQGTTVSPRLPITVDILRKICTTLHKGFYGPYIDLLLQTACIIAFFGFLRCGEFTSRDGKFIPDTHLCIRDIQARISKDGYVLTLKASKTDPFREGVRIHLFRTGGLICPWSAIQAFMSARLAQGALPDDPLFATPSGNIMSRSWFLDKLHTVLSRMGYVRGFSGHSFRSGAATSASNAQVPDHLIRVLGRWTSDCYCRYIKTPFHVLQQAHNKMCRS